MSFHHAMPFEDYLKLPGLSASALKKLMRSPMAYRYSQDHPMPSTAAMALGTAAHAAILEPDSFKDRFPIWGGGARRGKEWDTFCLNNEGRQILTVAEFEQVQGMARSVRTFDPAMRYLHAGEAEIGLTWDQSGRGFRGRLDWLTEVDGHPVIVDLKTTRDARPRQFGNSAFHLGYHIQFALYADGYQANTGVFPRFVVVCVESNAPHEPAVYAVPDDVLDKGREDYTRLLELLQECESTNTWPPSVQAEEFLSLPSYAYHSEDEDLSGLGLSA